MFDDLFDAYKGETCVVIGNGPSLKDVPPEFLDAYTTFGCNRVYTKFIPDYYVAINELVIQQFRKDILGIPCEKFIREGYIDIKHCHQLHVVDTPMFSFAPSVWVHDGHNTTFVELQLAFFMGFTTVILVGLDHRYEYTGGPNETQLFQGDDTNHFNPHYFQGFLWQTPDLDYSRKAYLMAKEAYEQNGRQILNMTPNSALDVFDIVEPTWVA